MPTDILRTTAAHPDIVDVLGAGTLPANGLGGITVEEAARQGLAELQEHGPDGLPAVRDGAFTPLKGKALHDAAQAFADRFDFIELASVKDNEARDLRAHLGLALDRPPAEQVAVTEYEQAYGAGTPTDTEGTAEPTGEAAAEPAPADKKEDRS